MDSFGGFGATNDVAIDLLTDSYSVAGSVQTRFGRVTDIVNQASGTHLTVHRATIREHADEGAALAAPSAMVAIGSILIIMAPSLTGTAAEGMRIEKRPVRVQLSVPPFHVTGTMHFTPGSVPAESLMNITDRFLAVTDVTVTSAAYPRLARTAAAVAVSRDRAHVLLVADDERPEEQLAEVLDERTAETWLGSDEAEENGER